MIPVGCVRSHPSDKTSNWTSKKRLWFGVIFVKGCDTSCHPCDKSTVYWNPASGDVIPRGYGIRVISRIGRGCCEDVCRAVSTTDAVGGARDRKERRSQAYSSRGSSRRKFRDGSRGGAFSNVVYLVYTFTALVSIARTQAQVVVCLVYCVCDHKPRFITRNRGDNAA